MLFWLRFWGVSGALLFALLLALAALQLLPLQVFQLYAMLIISFLIGSVWTRALRAQRVDIIHMLMVLFIVLFAAWFIGLWWLLHLIVLVAVYVIEKREFNLESGYQSLRTGLTLVVALLHGIAAVVQYV